MARALYHRQPIERWSIKRITLLGDAAHSIQQLIASRSRIVLRRAMKVTFGR